MQTEIPLGFVTSMKSVSDCHDVCKSLFTRYQSQMTLATAGDALGALVSQIGALDGEVAECTEDFVCAFDKINPAPWEFDMNAWYGGESVQDDKSVGDAEEMDGDVEPMVLG
jgi:hypothetical protein